ncbi:hypothetical protein JCM9279_002589 [Rhodotorula babjevae]
MDNKILISSTSTQDHHEPSLLLRLSDELLDEIFRLVGTWQEDDWLRPKTKHLPISRRLYPIQRRHLYRSIALGSYTALATLCATVRASPNLGDLVTSLNLHLDDEFNVPDDDDERIINPEYDVDEISLPEEDPYAVPWDDADFLDERKIVRPADWATLLAQLPHLKRLDLSYLATSLLHVILFDEATLSSLRHLEALLVWTGTTEGPPGVRPDAWVRQLARLPSLKLLELQRMRRDEDGDEEPLFPAFDAPLPSFDSVTTLVLGHQCHRWTGPALRDLFPHLVALSLHSVAFEPDLLAVLDGAPVGLQRLAIDSEPPWERPTTSDSFSKLDGLLPRFEHLKHLKLGPHFFKPDALLPILSSLPSLHSFTFSPSALATDDILASLLSGPARLEHLRVLTLDHLSARRGPTIASRGGRLAPHDPSDRNPPMYDGWLAPRDLVGCSSAGIVAAVEAGRAHGVRVDGTALGVIGWAEAHAEEEARAKELWDEEEPVRMAAVRNRASVRARYESLYRLGETLTSWLDGV